jgi:hypothetical protein
MIGRYCELNNEIEETKLKYGMDFRKPKYRREVFLRFYEFHLKNKAILISNNEWYLAVRAQNYVTKKLLITR